jgi:hypothetical protein
MKTISLFISALIFSFFICSSASASNYNFLNQSPISYFDQDDTTLMTDNVNTALNSARDGQKVTWRNPKTDAWGFAIPLHSTTKNGVRCRYIKILNSARRVSEDSRYLFCKIHGEWKYVSASR